MDSVWALFRLVRPLSDKLTRKLRRGFLVVEPRGGRDSDKITLDETVVNVNGGGRFWLYTAADPETNKILHFWLYPSRTIVLTKMSLRELRENHSIEDV